MSLDLKHAEARFSSNATDSLYLLVAQVPRPRDMAIFVLTTTTTTTTTTTRPITLPLAHARGVIMHTHSCMLVHVHVHLLKIHAKLYTLIVFVFSQHKSCPASTDWNPGSWLRQRKLHRTMATILTHDYVDSIESIETLTHPLDITDRLTVGVGQDSHSCSCSGQ